LISIMYSSCSIRIIHPSPVGYIGVNISHTSREGNDSEGLF
jgi:hypothetical protein